MKLLVKLSGVLVGFLIMTGKFTTEQNNHTYIHSHINTISHLSLEEMLYSKVQNFHNC